MTGKLICISDSIGKLWVLFQTEGVLFGKCRLKSRIHRKGHRNTPLSERVTVRDRLTKVGVEDTRGACSDFLVCRPFGGLGPKAACRRLYRNLQRNQTFRRRFCAP